jgi:hypothetical protein
MLSPYIEPHWNFFSSVSPQAQGSTGSVPAEWANRFELDVPAIAELPRKKVDRREVRSICIDPATHVLFGYACAMAWGGQGGGVSQPSVRYAWQHRTRLECHLTRLRQGATRSEAYNLFCAEGAIKGLGPSFFTKLLYFFSPSPCSYIMDQWTAKSINLLTGRLVVQMDGDFPSRRNTGENYRKFCKEVDSIAAMIGCSGQEAEERLFSQGGRSRWPWREYVIGNWNATQGGT